MTPIEQYRDALLVPPVWQEGGSRGLPARHRRGRPRHPLAADLRRALFAVHRRVVVTIALVGGIALGLLAGYFGGWVDTASSCAVMDIILAFPSLLLALVLVAILGPGLTNAMIAIALVYQPHFARLTRAAVMAEKEREYVTAAKVAGAGNLRLMFKTILPNCLAPLIVQATLSFSNAILDAAALGFLGMGAQPPTPEWGTMLAEAREFILRAWWVVTFPGLAILITVLAINLMGDGLRDALDPKLKRS
jgi:dipeptide transport system permease protein